MQETKTNAHGLTVNVLFEDINSEIARRALGKDKFGKHVALPIPSESVFGCAGGLHAQKGSYYYCPAFVIPLGRNVILSSDLHNFIDGTGYVGVKVTDAITGTILLGPVFSDKTLGAFQHIRLTLSLVGISGSLLLDIHAGFKGDDGTFMETSKFRVAIQVMGKPAVVEYSTNALDIVYPNAPMIYPLYRNKPFPIPTAFWLLLPALREGEYTLRMLPTLRLQGEPIKGSKLRFWAMNAGYYQSVIDLRYSSFDIDKAYWELESVKENLDMGYRLEDGSSVIIRQFFEATFKPELEERYAITNYFALGNQKNWWMPWNWKADEALMVAWGRPPSYYLDVIRASVVNFKPIREPELKAYIEDFIEDCNHRGAVGSYPAITTYSQKIWGGVLDTDVISPAYSPAVPLILVAIIFASVAAAIIAVGFVIFNHETIKYKELMKYDTQSSFDDTAFTNERDRLRYDQTNYPDEMKKSGQWGELEGGKWVFYDPITGEKAPPHIDTPVEHYDWMKSHHPDWAKDVYNEEVEVPIRPLLVCGVTTAGMYGIGSLLKGAGKTGVGTGLQVGAIIPACFALYYGYKYIKEKIQL